MRKELFLPLLAGAYPHLVNAAGVSGKPFGFATGVTGGGSAAAATPTSLAQLKQWLTDSTARTIMIDRTWDFTGSEGTTTGNCCSTRTTTCSGGTSKGQLTIAATCSDGTAVSCTWDTAGYQPIDVGSNKSIVGVGSKGVIKGKGLRVRGGNKNVIIQNIHITNINPQYVWGGDALTLDDADGIWIDHNKFSLIGRQMIVTGFGKAGKVTISNNDFDGNTSWSSGCNGKHYWTLLLAGLDDFYTFAYNHIHDVSGRAPHYGTTVTASTQYFHAFNNYFSNIGGHAFDVYKTSYGLLEGNYFDQVTTPMTPGSLTSGGALWTTATVARASACSRYTGYICEWNRASNSGAWPDVANAEVLGKFSAKKQYLVDPMDVASVPAYVKANAGIGKV
ncbi:pectin lyase-like protein [Xylaria palmicola]|nr:pectin lyase-like protein [Xylaria palmicola]